jgi:hypothetical protein
MPEEIEVPTEHLHETIKEQAEEHGTIRWISQVAISSALIAVAAAIASLLAGHHANEAMLEQMQATDAWAFYQAKGIKSSLLESKLDLLDALGKPAPAGERGKIAAYEHERQEIETHGHELETSSSAHMTRHGTLARSVTVYQIAIAMAAIAVLARRRKLWLVSVGLGLVGTAFMLQGIL